MLQVWDTASATPWQLSYMSNGHCEHSASLLLVKLLFNHSSTALSKWYERNNQSYKNESQSAGMDGNEMSKEN